MSKINLVIDQGNTRLKAGVFSGGRLTRKVELKEYSSADLLSLAQETSATSLLISSVSNVDLYTSLKSELRGEVYLLSHDQPLPFKSQYATPQTLGLDRIALSAGALHKFPGRDCLVIDAGTCITCDFLDSDGVYHGGSISPGLHMRYRSLSEFTARLPLVSHEKPADLIGDSTVNSIRSGVVNGILKEIEGTIEAYRQRFPEVQIIITGGDLNLFEPLLKNGIFADPDFLLSGLNHILEYYAEVL